MKILCFSTHKFEKGHLLERFEGSDIEIDFLETQLTAKTAKLAQGHEGVSAFISDQLGREVLSVLANKGVKIILLRSAGFNHVDLDAAKELGLAVARVPDYSPHAVAEHAMGLILGLNRKIHKAFLRTREHNFSIEGLQGFDVHGKTVGVIGTGKIGQAFCEMISGFGVDIIAYDVQKNPVLENLPRFRYGELDEIFEKSKIITLHVPLNSDTYHLIDERALKKMRTDVMLINTSRGGLMDTKAVLQALKQKRLAYLGIDVYEEEEGFFFKDFSEQIIEDDELARLLTFPNVIVTAHQAFLTQEALVNIAKTTKENADAFSRGEGLNRLC